MTDWKRKNKYLNVRHHRMWKWLKNIPLGIDARQFNFEDYQLIVEAFAASCDVIDSVLAADNETERLIVIKVYL